MFDDVVKSLKANGPAIAVVVAALVYFEVLQAGRKAPKFLKPKPATAVTE